jgi:small-conductance mechanosensitive channel
MQASTGFSRNDGIVAFGIRLVGVNAENGKKLLVSIAFIAVVWFLGWLLGRVASFFIGERSRKAAFWLRQGIHLFSAALVVVGLCSVWFDNPARLATAFGLVTAGLAFALQRVITAFAAYIVILRGSTFSVGDRIVMGGVRGDVIELGFIQTTIMEMGQPPAVQAADPAMWVRARQYTGRIVTLTNDKLFDMPVYNYTREFPFLWEEILIPIPYQADLQKAERILIDAVTKNTVQIVEIGEDALAELERRYFVKRGDLAPRAFIRLTDNWVELTVRFIVRDHEIRELKDKISREVLNALNQAGIAIASGTYQIVGMPPISVQLNDSSNLTQQPLTRS